MVTMFDSIAAGVLPSSARAVAGYVDGFWPSFGAIAARFYPRAHCLSITVHGNDAECCDCENGDLTPAQAEAWVQRMLAKGVWRPCVYANASTWESPVVPGAPTLYAALEHYGARIRRWVAAYPGPPGAAGTVPPGYDAHQYTDHGPNGENYDISACLDSFFPSPPPRPSPRPHPKITAAGIAGAFTAALEGLVHGTAGWHPSPEVAGVISLAAGLIAGYMKRG